MRTWLLDADRARADRAAVYSLRLAHGSAEERARAADSTIPVDDLRLSRRARNVLRKLGCRTLGDVIGLRTSDLAAARNCGPRTRSEIIDCARERGVALGDSPTISERAVVVGWERVELWDRGTVVAWCLAQDLARHPEWIAAIEDWAGQRVFRLVSFRRVGLRGLVRTGTGGARLRVARSARDRR